MAFPASIDSFTTKNAGDVIQPAHVNDLQTAVVAVETTLLTGPVPFPVTFSSGVTISSGGLTLSTGSFNQAGPSSVTTLQVNGGSTFAAPVVMSSGLAVTGSLTVGGASVLSQFKLSCDLTHGSSQTVSLNTWTGLSWNGESADVGGLHSTSANSSRITLTSTGNWIVGCSVEWESNSTGQRRLAIIMNDTTVWAVTCVPGFAAPIPQSITTFVRNTSTTDYVVARVFSNEASAIGPNSSEGYRFWATFLST